MSVDLDDLELDLGKPAGRGDVVTAIERLAEEVGGEGGSGTELSFDPEKLKDSLEGLEARLDELEGELEKLKLDEERIDRLEEQLEEIEKELAEL